MSKWHLSPMAFYNIFRPILVILFGAIFGSWLRTIRPGIPASANVVQESLRNQLYYFRHILPKDTRWGKWAKKILGKDPPATQKAA